MPATPAPGDLPELNQKRAKASRRGLFGRGRTRRTRSGGSRAFSAVRRRFLAVNLPLVLIAVLGLYGFSEWMVKQYSLSSLQTELHRMTKRIAVAVEGPVLTGNRSQIRNVLSGAAANGDVQGIRVLDAKKEVLVAVGKITQQGPASLRLTVPVKVTTAGESRTIGTVTVALTDARLVRATEARRRMVAIIALLLAMIAVVVGMVVQDTTVRVPLKRLSEAIRKREATGSKVPIEWKSNDEPGEVIRAFNELQEREDMYVSALRESKTRMEQRIQERDAEIAAAHGEIRAAVDSRRLFAASLSHRLRTPLTNIIGFANMIAKERLGPLDQRYKQYGSDIHESGRTLLRMVEDVLAYAHAESGALRLDEEDTKVSEIISGCVQKVAMVASTRDQNLTMVDIPDVTVRADVSKLQQVLLKLLSNAVTHTPEGGRVEVLCEIRRDGLRIHVTDNGPGIPLEAQDRIFQPFSKGGLDENAESDDNETGGAGLGLSLARSLVELHGGRLQVYSKPGRGTCMTVVLPPERVIEGGDA